MKLFDKFLSCLGFAGDDSVEVERKPLVKKNKSDNFAKFDLTKIKTKNNPKKFTPTSQNEVQEIVVSLKDNNCVIVDFCKLSEQDFVRCLDFLSGAVFGLGGNINKQEDLIFYIEL